MGFLYAFSIHLVLRFLLLFQGFFHRLLLLLLGLACGGIFAVRRIGGLGENRKAKAGGQESKAESGGESFHGTMTDDFWNDFTLSRSCVTWLLRLPPTQRCRPHCHRLDPAERCHSPL